jgi:hypothetical protein
MGGHGDRRKIVIRDRIIVGTSQAKHPIIVERDA